MEKGRREEREEGEGGRDITLKLVVLQVVVLSFDKMK